MTDKVTEVVIVLDKSGSMFPQRDSTIEGVNTFLSDLKKDKSTKCLVTLIQFDHEYEVNYMSKSLDEVEFLTHADYIPRGNTALHDAIGKTISGITVRHESMPEEDRPTQVIFMIITDGYENCSKEFKGKAKTLIEGKSDWDFMYLGAGIDEINIAKEYGIPISTTSSFNYSSSGIGSTFSSASSLINESRDLYSLNQRRSLRSVAKDINFKASIEGSQNAEIDSE